MKKLLTALILTLLLASQALALDVPSPPYAYVLDRADIFTSDFESELNQTISNLETETSAEIAILTITALEDEYLEGYATEVFREWGIGQNNSDNGLLLLIAVEDREVRIEVGYGLEGRITDWNSSLIIENTIVPYFKEEAYETGTREAIEELAVLIRQEATEEGFEAPDEEGSSYNWGGSTGMEAIWPTFSGVILFFFLMSVYGFLKKDTIIRVRKWYHPPIIMLFSGYVIKLSLFGLGVCLGVGFLIRYILLKMDPETFKKLAKAGAGNYRHRGGGGSSSRSSRSSSSSSSSSGSSSGQNFGGGSSGGGGASGKW